MNFEDYLISKRIDSAAFKNHEPELWQSWKSEFDQIHPASFTQHKLYLLNPIRRKYILKVVPVKVPNLQIVNTATAEAITNSMETGSESPKPAAVKPAIPRPVFKPKPKTT